MQRWTTELKVGLFVLVTLAILFASWTYFTAGVRADEKSYTLRMVTASSDGLYAGSAVRIAGVEVGSVEAINLMGDKAEIILRFREEYQLANDSEGELKASGLLGDYYIRVYPGAGDIMLADGDLLGTRSEPGDIDKITRNLDKISDDISAITGAIRLLVENRDNSDHIEATLANVDMLSQELKEIAKQNHGDINAIIDSVRRLSESLEGYADDLAGGADEEIDKLKVLTDDLDEAAKDLGSITGKIDRGEGTIGALINERETVDRLNSTIGDVQGVVRSFAKLRPEFYYVGRYYMGTQPTDTSQFFYGNPLAWSAANTVGIRLRAHEDFWYLFEINDYPQGVISQKEVLDESTGLHDTRYTRTADYRFSFQVEKRWGHFSFRLGLREGGGGVGATAWLAHNKLQFSADVFDFFFGSYPALESQGIPNVRLAARYEPGSNFFVEAGAEQIVLGAKYGFFTGYVGLGFHFGDDNLRWVMSSVPGL